MVRSIGAGYLGPSNRSDAVSPRDQETREHRQEGEDDDGGGERDHDWCALDGDDEDGDKGREQSEHDQGNTWPRTTQVSQLKTAERRTGWSADLFSAFCVSKHGPSIRCPLVLR